MSEIVPPQSGDDMQSRCVSMKKRSMVSQWIVTASRNSCQRGKLSNESAHRVRLASLFRTISRTRAASKGFCSPGVADSYEVTTSASVADCCLRGGSVDVRRSFDMKWAAPDRAGDSVSVIVGIGLCHVQCCKVPGPGTLLEQFFSSHKLCTQHVLRVGERRCLLTGLRTIARAGAFGWREVFPPPRHRASRGLDIWIVILR